MSGSVRGRHRFVPGTLAMAGGLALGAAAAGAAPVVTVVTAAVQVTANPAPVRSHSAPQIARNPRNGELVVVESDVRGTGACNVYISVDDGRSWAPGGDPAIKPYTDCGFYAEYGAYATLAFSKEGTLFVAFVASEKLNRTRNETPRHVYLARSDDSGRTFTTTRVFQAPEGNQDKGLTKGPMLAVDPTDSKRIYAGWRQGIFAADAKEKLKSNVAASTDGGHTFGPAFDLTDDRGGDYPGLAVGKDGTVHAVYWSRIWPVPPTGTPPAVRPIYYRQSTDHGQTWSPAKEIDPGNQRADRPPLVAADPKSSSVYVVWYASSDPMNSQTGYDGDQDVFFLRSGDGGKTWAPRTVLNDDKKEGRKASQIDPSIAIAPNGRVDVVWYDARLSPQPPAVGTAPDERGMQDVYYTSSSDRGRTFSANIRVTDRSIDRSLGVWSNNIGSHFNVGVASSDNAVYVAWQDTRNANLETQPDDVYMASIQLAGLARGKEHGGGGVPSWLLLGAGLAVGMGATLLVASRRR